MEKGSAMYSERYSDKAWGRFTALAFAATLAMGFSFASATDAPATGKSAPQGVVAEKAIHADGEGDCAKRKEDCPKKDCPKESKADCCKKGVKGSGHHKHDHKGAEANAAPTGSIEKPAGTPAEADKGASHPG